MPAAVSGAGVPRHDPDGSVQAVKALGRRAGNRAVSRRVGSARGLRGPALARAPQPAVEHTTAANRPLAEAIDTVRKLDDATLANRHRELLNELSSGEPSTRGGLVQELRAVDFVSAERGLPALTTKGLPLGPKARVEIEQLVRQKGSLDDAIIAYVEAGHMGDAQIALVFAEAETFGTDFRNQAYDTAYKLLDGSLRSFATIVAQYGLPTMTESSADTWLDKAHRVPEYRRAYESRSSVAHRRELGESVQHLRDLQRPVADLRRAIAEQERWIADRHDSSDLAWAVKKHAFVEHQLKPQLERARRELATAWIEAERAHGILAAYRSTADFETADLGALAAGSDDDRMRAALSQIAPRIANIRRAQQALRGGEVSPLQMPPVVELTRAAMFVTPGSIWDGKVNEMVRKASEKGWVGWLVEAALMALALITLLPSGGASLGIPAAWAGLGYGVYTAVKEYERYGLQKALVDTDLDRARSLSNEEPSLAGFAWALVNAGLSGLPLAVGFARAVALRRLAFAGDVGAAAALDKLGAQHGIENLGEDALRAGGHAPPPAAKAGADPVAPGGEPPRAPAHEPPGRPPAPEPPATRPTTGEPQAAKPPAPEAAEPPHEIDPRVKRAQKTLDDAVGDAKKAQERAAAGTERLDKARKEVADADRALADAREELDASREASRRTKAAYDQAKQAPRGTPRQGPRASDTAARAQVKRAAKAVEDAQERLGAARSELTAADKAAAERAELARRAAAKVERAQAALEQAHKAVAEGEVPRLVDGEPYTKEKWRPLFGRKGPTLPGRVNVTKVPLQGRFAARLKKILKLAETNPQQAGNEFAQLVGEKEGWGEIGERFTQHHGRIGRRWDFGNTKEMTIEGRIKGFGADKLDQLWFDLNEHGSIDLTVPMLSPEAEAQLARLAGEWNKWTGKLPWIMVRTVAL